METASSEGTVRRFAADARAAEAISAAIEQRGADGPRVPDFFVLGHPKCGTTALHGMLAQHPQIHVAGKEPSFFSTELRVRDTPSATPKTLAEYEAWFDGAEPSQIVGDVSVTYLWSRYAPALIAKLQPEARVIAMLREPASFMRSLHMQWLQDYVETETDLERALDLEVLREEGRELPADTYWPKALFYSQFTCYVEQLKRYRELFPPEQILVLIYEDFRDDNEGTVNEVLDFLGVEGGVSLARADSNTSVEVASPRMHALMRSLVTADRASARVFNRAVKALTPAALRRDALRAVRDRFVYRPAAAPQEELMSELRSRFRPQVVALSEYLDRDLLARWGYEATVA